MKIRLLRGRVAMREDRSRSAILFTPDESESDRKYKTKVHVGTVLGMGPPQLTKKGHEITPNYAPGDKVYFVFGREMVEAGREIPWEDGLPCYIVAADEVIGVVEKEESNV